MVEHEKCDKLQQESLIFKKIEKGDNYLMKLYNQFFSKYFLDEISNLFLVKRCCEASSPNIMFNS